MDIDSLADLFIKDLAALGHKKRGVVSFAVKKNLAAINGLNKRQGFSLAEILGVINNAGGEGFNVSYKAFYAAVSRANELNDEGQPFHENQSRELSEPYKVRAHENKPEKPKSEPENELEENALPEGWQDLLERHPTIKAISFQKAIASGLSLDKAKAASKEGTKQLLEVLNKYRSKNFR